MKRTFAFALSLLLSPLLQAHSDSMSEFTVPTAASGPAFIALGADSLLWFTESTGNKVASINTTSGAIKEYPLPHSSSKPWGISKGPDGNIWFTERDGDRIGKISASGTITEYALTAGAEPYQITNDETNGVLWFTEYGLNKVAKITPGGIITEYSIPTSASKPTGLITIAGDLWFCEENGNKLGHLDVNGAFTEFTIATAGSLPNQLFVDTGGSLWITLPGAGKVAKSTLNGIITEYAVTTAANGAMSIAQGPIGTPLWFTESSVNQIGKIGFNGTMVDELPITTSASKPFAIVLDTHKRLWFTEKDGNNISKITPTSALTITTDSHLPAGTTGSPYSRTITASGGTTSYSFSSIPGSGFSLPDGLTLASNGTLSGTPTATGTYFIQVKVTDSADVAVFKAFTILIPSSPLPDLKPRLILKSKTGRSATYSVRAINQGLGDAGSFSLKVIASTDKKIDRRDTTLLSQTIPSLAAQTVTSQELAVRNSRVSGKRYIGVCVNCDKSLPEELTNNNTSFLPIR